MSAKSQDIFLDEKNSERSDSQQLDNQPSIPYLKRGDSAAYINQFLDGSEHPPAPLPSCPPVVVEQPREENAHSEQDSHSDPQPEARGNPSAFHNFQKHLTVALKHAIRMPAEEKSAKESVKAAVKLWKIFAQSKICTKKVLHFLLGDRNQHQITTEDLREFGFAKVYDAFGEKSIREARIFLQREALRQIQEGHLEAYFELKKIKDKQKFKKYVEMFVEELQAGFLRKRLPREKVEELLA